MKTYAGIHATTLGSTMGASTEVEIISDRDLSKRVNYLRDKIEEMEDQLEQIDKVAETVKRQMAANQEVLPEQLQYIKKAAASKPVLVKELHEMKYEKESILIRIEKNKNAGIRVEDTVYSGVKVLVKDAVKMIHDQVSHCKFVRDGADVLTKGL